jgi:hypothetical protein
MLDDIPNFDSHPAAKQKSPQRGLFVTLNSIQPNARNRWALNRPNPISPATNLIQHSTFQRNQQA